MKGLSVHEDSHSEMSISDSEMSDRSVAPIR